MKVLLNSYTGIGAYFILRFLKEKHSVDYYQMSKDCLNILSGIVPSPLITKPDYSKYDLSLFDITGKASLAEESSKVTPTMGDGKIASDLEDDRLFGIRVMEESKILVPPYEVFDDIEKAANFVRKTKKKYVFKPYGGQDQKANTTYVSSNYKDLLEYMSKLSEFAKDSTFLLQEFIEGGTEVSTEAYFNGQEFFAVNHTLEEKKLMNDNIGPATGCSGNLVWFCTEGRESKIFKEGLLKFKEFLSLSDYRGMVDLNSIVLQNGELYGLEWTPRFGYDATVTSFSLFNKGDLVNFLHAIACGETPKPASFKEDYFAASVRVSIPPYPSEIKGQHPQGVPIQGINEDNIHKYYLWDAMMQDGQLVTSGEAYGCVTCPVAKGVSCNAAFANVYNLIAELKIPDMQYRTDMAQMCKNRFNSLERMGWLRP